MTNARTLPGLHLDLPSTDRAARAVLGRMKSKRQRWRPQPRPTVGLVYADALRLVRPEVARQLDAEQRLQMVGHDERTLWDASPCVVLEGDPPVGP